MQATLAALTLPTKDDDQAVLHLRFDKLIFANGYTVLLADGAQHAPLTRVTILVSLKNDVLLDNGMWLHMLLPNPIVLDAQQIAQAAQLSIAPGPFQPGTLCHSTASSQGSPGMPDMNIPGNSSTPDQVVTGGTNGTVTLHGRQGTPDMYIPGHPGDYSSGKPIVCPEPPSIRASVPETSSQIASAATQANPALQPQALPTLTVPAGVDVPLTLSQAVTRKSLKIGKPVSAKVVFPATIGSQLAIPAGTVAQGTIAGKSEVKKTHLPIATLHFTRLVYPNGYTITLDEPATAEDHRCVHSGLDRRRRPLQPRLAAPDDHAGCVHRRDWEGLRRLSKIVAQNYFPEFPSVGAACAGATGAAAAAAAGSPITSGPSSTCALLTVLATMRPNTFCP